jgi:ureidoglycolate lyase
MAGNPVAPRHAVMRVLAPRPLEADAFAPFGTLIRTDGRGFELVNDGTARRYPDLAALDVRDPVLGIYVANARPLPLRIRELERHRQAAQVFIPLGSHRFVVVVAPGAQAPDWEAAVAFISAPGDGVALRRGCWHHGLIALGDGDRFAVIEGGNYRSDTGIAAAPFEIEVAAPA